MRPSAPLALLGLAVLSLVLLARPALAQSAPAYPRTAAMGGEAPMCLLTSLTLQGQGLRIKETFQTGRFEYTCEANDWNAVGFGAGSPTLTARTMDWSSNSEVWFNGRPVNTRLIGNPLTNEGTDTSLPLADFNHQFIAGQTNLIQVHVGCNVPDDVPVQHCDYVYVIKCYRPAASSFVTGDPQFVGLRGQNYQVHGVAGEVYNIVSDSELQYNSRFVFLNNGECPVVNGRKQKGCFSHPGSYLGELGLKTRAGDRIHLKTGGAKHGFDAVTVNGRAVGMGETVLLKDDMGSVTRNSTHLASVLIGNWDFAFENSDHFVNQRVRVLDSRRMDAHGLLGQTWRDKTYKNPVKYIEGRVDDYVVRERNIFGDDFHYNKFQRQ